MSLHEGAFMLWLCRTALKLVEMIVRSGDPGGAYRGRALRRISRVKKGLLD